MNSDVQLELLLHSTARAVLGEESVLEVDERRADEVVGRRQVVVPDLDLEPRAHRERHVELEQSAPTDNTTQSAVWRSGSVVRRKNEVTLRYVEFRLVPDWVTVFGRVQHLGT